MTSNDPELVVRCKTYPSYMNLLLIAGFLLLGFWLLMKGFQLFTLHAAEAESGGLMLAMGAGIFLITINIWFLFQTIKYLKSDKAGLVVDDDGIQILTSYQPMPKILWSEIQNISIERKKLSKASKLNRSLIKMLLIEVRDVKKYLVSNPLKRFYQMDHDIINDKIAIQTSYLDIGNEELLEKLYNKLEFHRQQQMSH